MLLDDYRWVSNIFYIGVYDKLYFIQIWSFINALFGEKTFVSDKSYSNYRM